MARRRAREVGVPCTITRDDIVIPPVCPVLGKPFVRGTRGHTPYSPTLDRLIPEWGYVPGNVIVISYRANAIKSDGTAEDVRRVGEWMHHAGLS